VPPLVGGVLLQRFLLGAQPVDFQRILLNTNTPDDAREAPFDIGDVYDVTARSCLLFRLNA
jgi:hypothetical protein